KFLPAQIFLLCPNFAPNSFPIWNIARSFRGRRRKYSFFVRISPQIHSRYGISRDLFEGAGATIPSLSKFRPKFIPDMEYRAIFSRAPAQLYARSLAFRSALARSAQRGRARILAPS